MASRGFQGKSGGPKRGGFGKKRGKFNHREKFGEKKKNWEFENEEIAKLQTELEDVS